MRDHPELLVSETDINVTLEERKPWQGIVRAGAADGSRIRGRAYSDDPRILIAMEGFSGNVCSIVYGIDTTGLNSGDVVSGNLFLVTSIGERTVHIRGTVTEEQVSGDESSVNTLDDFARLAQKDFRSAFVMFTGDNFTRLLKGRNTVYQSLYRGLSKNPVTYQHLEEFLVTSGKKSPVHISVDKAEKTVYHINSSFKDTIYVYKSTWGHCSVEVSVSGNFIEVDRKVLSDNDFIGRAAGLEFIINKEKMEGNYRVGRIRLKTAYDTIILDIEVFGDKEDMRPLTASFRKRCIAKLVRAQLDLQMKKISYREWYEVSSAVVQDMKEDREDSFTMLWEAYLCYTQESYSKAIEILWPFKSGDVTPQGSGEKAAYLYLSKAVGLLPAEKRNIAPRLYALYQQEPRNYLALELYLKEDEESSFRPTAGLAELEKAFEYGCISPFLYLKAWRQLENQESLLRKLSPFYIRVLMFAQKEGLITDTMVLRAAYLSGTQKYFSPVLFRLLADGYEKKPDKELLEAICKYIMKGSPLNKSYYKWYERAVAEDIRLTRLYEYYMATRPAEESSEYPQNVRLYFLHSKALSDSKKAGLYADIVRHKDTDPSSYSSYRDECAEYALKELLEEHISDDLAVLYHEFLEERHDLEIYNALSKIMFKKKFTTDDPDIREVIICHPALVEELTFHVTDGVAYPDIYGPEVTIILEDDKKRRFSSTIPYELHPVLDTGRLVDTCVELGIWDKGIQLYSGDERERRMEINSRNARSYWRAAENTEFTRPYRDRLRKKLLDYFENKKDDLQVEPYIKVLKENTYGWIDKAKTVDLLLRFAQYDRAFALITKMGYEGIDDETLHDIAREYTGMHPDEEIEELLALDSYLYRRGNADERIIVYLLKFFNSSLDEMCGLWEKAHSLSRDTSELSARILLTSMFVRRIPDKAEEILKGYISWDGDRTVIKAYLLYLSGACLLEDRQLSGSTVYRIGALCDEKEDKTDLAYLAWLKVMSAREDISEEDAKRIKRLLRYLNDEGIRLSFMKDLPKELCEGYELEDKCFVEERFESGSRVTICYSIISGDGAESDERREPLKEVIKGLYVREFLLFYGEKLKYSCRVASKDKETVTEEKIISVDTHMAEGQTRYDLLNRVLAANAIGAQGKAREAAAQYLWQDAFVNKFFG